MKKKWYWIIGIIIIIIVGYLFFLWLFGWHSSPCLRYREQFNGYCKYCDNKTWTEEMMIPNKLINDIKYCDFAISIRDSLSENMNCKTIQPLCKELDMI